MSELISRHRSERFGKKESVEISPSRRIWLGGAFEVGGGIYYSIHERDNAVVSHIEISDSSPTVLEKLHRELGGSFRPRSKSKSFVWIVSGHEASHVAISMNPFAPSRRGIIDIIEELGRNKNPKERVAMVRRFREEEVADSTKAEDYSELVRIPEFVAGVIDVRGAVYSSPVVPRHPPQLRVHTTNKPLVEALIREFGGEMTLDSSKGSIVAGRYVTKKDGLHWALGMEKTAGLYQFIKQHLLGGTIKGYRAPDM